MSVRLVARRRASGQAMVEYLVVGTLLAAAMFYAEFDGKTAAQYLVDMIKAFFQNLTYYISLP